MIERFGRATSFKLNLGSCLRRSIYKDPHTYIRQRSVPIEAELIFKYE